MPRVPGREAVYAVAEMFKIQCLGDHKSLLWPERSVWTAENTSALWQAFMDRPDTGKRSFREKWHDQLQDQSDDVHRMAVELIALYNLFPTNIGKEAKLRDVSTVLGWKLSHDKPNVTLLEQAFDRGLGHSGIHYLTAKPWQIAFYLKFSGQIIQDSIDLGSAQACREVADRVQSQLGNGGSARNIILHLFFPEQFERIASERMKRQIIDGLGSATDSDVDQDEALRTIRAGLQTKYGRENFDFWDRDVASLWRGSEAEAVKFWVEKTIVRGRADREQGEFAVGRALWSPKQDKRGGDIYRFMREVKPGDVVFHLSDNQGITAVSRVDGEFEEFNGVPDTEWGTGPSYLVRLRDTVNLVPPLDRDIFFSKPFDDRLSSLIKTGAKNLFFNRDLALNQGAYLTPAPPELVKIFDDAYTTATQTSLAELIPEIADISPTVVGNKTWIFQANPEIFDIRAALRQLTRTTWLVTRFKDEMRLGDRVYIWESGPEGGVVGVAEIAELPAIGLALEEEKPFTKEAEKFSGEHLRATLKVLRRVDPTVTRGDLQARPELKDLSIFRLANATNFRVTEDEARVLDKIIRGTPNEPVANAPSILDLAEATNFTTEELEEIESLLRAKRQLIFEGPPGAGKTYMAELFGRYFTGNLLNGFSRSNLLTIQFHQSYGYEDFIQGIRPETNGKGQLEYHVQPGLFKAFCDEARKHTDPFVVIIDEINRGNISRIFGELLFLLEYRDKEIPLPYDHKMFSIPKNLYLIGTMNTTDRSLAQIDYALRRRFYFYRLSPVTDGRALVLEKALLKLGVAPESRAQILSLFISLNMQIQERLGEHFQVGHSHFIRPDIGNRNVLTQVWNRSVIPLLEEYFYNSRDRGSVLGEFTIDKMLSKRTA